MLGRLRITNVPSDIVDLLNIVSPIMRFTLCSNNRHNKFSLGTLHSQTND